MFNEDEDWSDEQDAQILSAKVLRTSARANNSTTVKPKLVGKKSLMRTLQTLGSVPEWKNEERQHNSDSDAEVAPSHGKKRRKKRRKRKQAVTTEEQQEDGDVEQTAAEEKPATKKRKKDKLAGKTTNVSSTKDKEMTKSATEKANKPEETDKLSRKQWRNKMKNKRKSTNKYREKKPEEETPKSAEQHKPTAEEPDTNNKTSPAPAKNKKKQKQKPLKRKNTENTDTASTTDTQESGKIMEKCETKSPKQELQGPKQELQGSKQEASGPEVEILDDQDLSPTKRPKPELSKAQTLKRAKLRKMLRNQEVQVQKEVQVQPEAPEEDPALPEAALAELSRSDSLRSRMQQRLESARFRYINEVMYSTSSGEARRMFRQDPEAFGIYHRGYTAQVQRWPSNPVDAIISYIRQKPASLVVADFGCGDCKIARSVKNKVHSFDLAAACELVTVCDMANVPLADSSVDIAVFCLSLMGTNLADFLAEANRVLKRGGFLKIAEVASRFENVRNFVTALANLGFKLMSKDTEKTHFYSFEFLKTGDAPENIKKFGLQLRPCVYKKR